MAGPTITAGQIQTMVAVVGGLNADLYADDMVKSVIYLAKTLCEETDKPGHVSVKPFVIVADA